MHYPISLFEGNVLQSIVDRPAVLKHLDKIRIRATRSHMRGTEVAGLVTVLRDAEIHLYTGCGLLVLQWRLQELNFYGQYGLSSVLNCISAYNNVWWSVTSSLTHLLPTK